MSLLSSVAIFFVIWWVVLFAVLPFGVRSQHEMNDVTLGTEHGAPHEPYILRKILATTVIAALIFGVFYLYFAVYGKTLEDLMTQSPDFDLGPKKKEQGLALLENFAIPAHHFSA